MPQAATGSSAQSAEFQPEQMFAHALIFCCHALGHGLGTVLKQLENGQHSTHSALRYSLGKQAAAIIGEHTDGVHAVYIHGSCVQDEAGPASDIDLILLVAENCSASKLLSRLNSSLKEEYRQLLGTAPDHGLLSFRLLTNVDIGKALSLSVHNPPLLLWEKH